MSTLEASSGMLVSLEILTEGDLNTARIYCENPLNVVYGPIFVAAWGRKPV